MVVSEATGVLVEQLSFKSSSDYLKTGTNVTKLLHLGGGSDRALARAHTDEAALFPPLAKGVHALYDGVFSGTSDIWNASETKVANLSAGEKVQFVHVDGNLHLDNAAAGTVLVGFLIQGTIHVSGEARHPAASKELPAGVLTMVGLVVAWDIWVEDDQSLAIVDLCKHATPLVPGAATPFVHSFRELWLDSSYLHRVPVWSYCVADNEQLKVGHMYVDSSRLAAAQPSLAKRTPGRISVLGAKMSADEHHLLNATDYYGEVLYGTGMWFEGGNGPWTVQVSLALPLNCFEDF